MIQLYNGDCLQVMDDLISKGIKVDCIITDPPYGTTACKWDSIIPFDEMWKRLNLLIKDNGAIVLFGSEPFSSALRISNIKNYKYDWIWEKNTSGSFALAKKRPFQYHELISVFYQNQCLYNPQYEQYSGKRANKKGKVQNINDNNFFETKTQNIKQVKSELDFDRGSYPKMIQQFFITNKERLERLHPTQKPVALLEYLVKTYTNENDTVLDFTMGSGSTGVACKNLNRQFIGIELYTNYFEIAKERMK